MPVFSPWRPPPPPREWRRLLPSVRRPANFRSLHANMALAYDDNAAAVFLATLLGLYLIPAWIHIAMKMRSFKKPVALAGPVSKLRLATSGLQPVAPVAPLDAAAAFRSNSVSPCTTHLHSLRRSGAACALAAQRCHRTCKERAALRFVRRAAARAPGATTSSNTAVCVCVSTP